MSETIFSVIAVSLGENRADGSRTIEICVVFCTPEIALDDPQSWSAQCMPGGRWMFDRDVSELSSSLDGTVLVGHDLKFILDHLNVADVDCPSETLDTLPIAEVLYPEGYPDPNEHADSPGGFEYHPNGASAKAEATRRLLLSLQRHWAELDPTLQQYVLKVNDALEMRSPIQVFISTSLHGPKTARPLRPERPKARPADTTTATARAPKPPPRVDLPNGSLAALTAAAFDRAAADAANPGMEYRKEQRSMALDVAKALDEGQMALIEAGTGVGKSLAYLVPAALWAMREGKRAVVSTHVRNLQVQLAQDDFSQLRTMLSYVSPALGSQLQAAVLKGRDNYLCHRALDDALARGIRAEDVDAAMLLARAVVWAQGTRSGDKEALGEHPGLRDAWPRLSAAGVNCLSGRSEYVAAGACFLARAFDAAVAAHVTVVNHAWLITNLRIADRAQSGDQPQTPYASLGNPDAVIIDEAHELEDVTTNAFRESADEDDLLGRLEVVASYDRRRASTPSSRSKVGQPMSAKNVRDRAVAASDAVETAWDAFHEFFDDFARTDVLALTDGVRRRSDWVRVERNAEFAAEKLRALTAELRAFARSIDGDGRGSDRSRLADDAHEAADAFEQADHTLTTVASADPAETVVWIEKQRLSRVSQRKPQRRGSSPVTLETAPVDVAKILRQILWARCARVVLTGATLTVDRKWSFLRERLGLPPQVTAERYESPFDYHRNARMFIPSDIADIATADTDDFARECADVVQHLVRAADGRTLALFTNIELMDRVAGYAREKLGASNIALKVQRTDGSPAQVVKDLRRNPRTVVFGVDSLWAGVDVPGPDLSQVLICRIPFRRPNDPILAARSELLDGPGRDSFAELHVPLAMIKLRQGVGRLIRTSNDTGAIVFLDKRIETKSYGARLVDSLPPAPVSVRSAAEIAKAVAAFLSQSRSDA